MSNCIPGNQKHLTLNDRLYIENELAKGTLTSKLPLCDSDECSKHYMVFAHPFCVG